jgi:hypothetical protein
VSRREKALCCVGTSRVGRRTAGMLSVKHSKALSGSAAALHKFKNGLDVRGWKAGLVAVAVGAVGDVGGADALPLLLLLPSSPCDAASLLPPGLRMKLQLLLSMPPVSNVCLRLQPLLWPLLSAAWVCCYYLLPLPALVASLMAAEVSAVGVVVRRLASDVHEPPPEELPQGKA